MQKGRFKYGAPGATPICQSKVKSLQMTNYTLLVLPPSWPIERAEAALESVIGFL